MSREIRPILLVGYYGISKLKFQAMCCVNHGFRSFEGDFLSVIMELYSINFRLCAMSNRVLGDSTMMCRVKQGFGRFDNDFLYIVYYRISKLIFHTMYRDWKGSFVRREENNVAQCLARFASDIDDNVSWSEEVLHFLILFVNSNLHYISDQWIDIAWLKLINLISLEVYFKTKQWLDKKL